MVVVLDAVFVAHHLPVQFVHQFIHRSVQILMCTFGKHVISFDMNTAFRALPSLFFLLVFNCKEHFDVHDLVKMSHDPI